MSLKSVAARSQLGLAWLYSYAVLLGALTLWVFEMADSPPLASSGSIPWWVVMSGFFLVYRFVVHMHFRSESGSFSFFEIPMIMGVLFTEPKMLIPAVFAGTFLSLVALKRPPVKIAFNVANFSLYVAVCWVLLDRVIGSTDVLSPLGWVAVLGSCLVGSFVQLTN